MQLKKSKYPRIAVLALVSVLAWGFACLYGEFLGRGANELCYKYLGCTSGFFGYDAIEHFLFGLAAIWIIVWVCGKFPKYSILHAERWKTVLILIALAALISVAWELFEFAHDIFRLDILREHLLNWRLHINLLDQPTNTDTMGDLTFSLFGSILASFFVGSSSSPESSGESSL